MRNLKVLGLAFIAMLAFSAVAATAASADDLTSESTPVTLTGVKDPETTDQFVTTAGTVTCTTPSYKATGVATPTTSVTATATYAGCTTSGLPTVIDMNGCTYKFNIGAATTGDADLVCSGNEVVVTAGPSTTLRCTIRIKAQSDIAGTVTYSNLGSGATREITVNADLSGIDYSHTAGTGLGACTSGSATAGTLKAKAVITGENAAGTAHIGIFLS